MNNGISIQYTGHIPEENSQNRAQNKQSGDTGVPVILYTLLS
jgi:hypothetical protein